MPYKIVNYFKRFWWQQHFDAWAGFALSSPASDLTGLWILLCGVNLCSLTLGAPAARAEGLSKV